MQHFSVNPGEMHHCVKASTRPLPPPSSHTVCIDENSSPVETHFSGLYVKSNSFCHHLNLKDTVSVGR